MIIITILSPFDFVSEWRDSESKGRAFTHLIVTDGS